MSGEKLVQLRKWRDTQAKKEGVEAYRVLSNHSLEEIVYKDVKTQDALLAIKGIKEKKLAKYGRAILEIMNGSDSDTSFESFQAERALDEIISRGEEKIFSVSVFLDLVNVGLRTFEVKIQGEVTSVDERGNVYYFNLKDKTDGSTVSCLIWKNNHRMAGLELIPGIEIVAHGFPNIYKPSGRISFQADTLELVGEGALKQQFEELKKKLGKEGLFTEERKKNIPLFPQKIGLITSRQGEAIFDFRTNLGKFGFQIKFFDSRVEGVLAVPALIRAVKYFKNKDIDVLVLVRGGGSLESLLSFNNEMLVREIADFPKPVVSGIGHEQDVSLVDLVADRSCSTPTGVAKFLSYSWEQALSQVNIYEKDIFNVYRKNLDDKKYRIENYSTRLRRGFSTIFDHFNQLDFQLRERFLAIGSNLKKYGDYLVRVLEGIVFRFSTNLQKIQNELNLAEGTILANDPGRQLRLGYSLVRVNGKIFKTVSAVGKGEEIKVELADGEIMSRVSDIKKYD